MSYRTDFIVMKLSRATGAEIGRKEIDGAASNDVALAAAVDARGDSWRRASSSFRARAPIAPS